MFFPSLSLSLSLCLAVPALRSSKLAGDSSWQERVPTAETQEQTGSGRKGKSPETSAAAGHLPPCIQC